MRIGIVDEFEFRIAGSDSVPSSAAGANDPVATYALMTLRIYSL